MGAGRPPKVKDLSPIDHDTSSSSDEESSTGPSSPMGGRGPLVSRLLEHLQCPACREPYRDAKLLPCLCTFCGPCVAAMFEQQQEAALYSPTGSPSSTWRMSSSRSCSSSGSELEPIAEGTPFRCPGCSKACPPELHHEDLPSHHLANNLVDLWRMLGGGGHPDGLHKCEECAGTVPSRTLSRCAECLQYLCEACTGHHRRAVTTRTHTIISLTELFESSDLHPLAACKRLTCASHPHRAVECFCHDCEQGVCMLCSMTTCGGHKRSELEAVAGAERDALEDLMCELTDKVQRLSLEAAWRQADADNVGAKLTSVVPEIEGAVAEVMAAVEAAASKVKERVLGQVGQVRTELKRQIGSMEGRVLAAESALQCAASIIGRCSDSEIIELKDIVRSRLLELLSEDWEHERPNMLLKFDMRDVVHEAVVTFKHLMGGDMDDEDDEGHHNSPHKQLQKAAAESAEVERLKRRCDDLAFELEQSRMRGEALERMVAVEAHKMAVARAELEAMREMMARDSAATTLERVREFLQLNRATLCKALASTGASLVIRSEGGHDDVIKVSEPSGKAAVDKGTVSCSRSPCDIAAFLASTHESGMIAPPMPSPTIAHSQILNSWVDKGYGAKELMSLEQLFGLSDIPPSPASANSPVHSSAPAAFRRD